MNRNPMSLTEELVRRGRSVTLTIDIRNRDGTLHDRLTTDVEAATMEVTALFGPRTTTLDGDFQPPMPMGHRIMLTGVVTEITSIKGEPQIGDTVRRKFRFDEDESTDKETNAKS